MAAKKKAKKKKPAKKSTGKKSKPLKKQAKRKTAPARKPASKKKAAKAARPPARKAAPAKRKAVRPKRPVPAVSDARPETTTLVAFPTEKPTRRRGALAGDLQGLSAVEGANSESVDELLEEGNAFEADAVRGVEQAGNHEGQEVHTHEVPTDDVPDEYLEND